MTRTAAIVTTMILAASFGCGEDQNNRYARSEDLHRAGGGSRSWFPPHVPPSASHLEEWHNLDTNIVAGRFRLPCSEVGKYVASLRPTSVPGAELVSDDVDWPECLRGEITQTRVQSCGMKTYRDGPMMVAVDARQCVVYFWN